MRSFSTHGPLFSYEKWHIFQCLDRIPMITMTLSSHSKKNWVFLYISWERNLESACVCVWMACLSKAKQPIQSVKFVELCTHTHTQFGYILIKTKTWFITIYIIVVHCAHPFTWRLLLSSPPHDTKWLCIWFLIRKAEFSRKQLATIKIINARANDSVHNIHWEKSGYKQKENGGKNGHKILAKTISSQLIENLI